MKKLTDSDAYLTHGPKVFEMIYGRKLFEHGNRKEFYTLRTRDKNELFPWDFIDTGVSRKFLRKEWERAMNAEVTPNCREHCSGCGASKFGGGVCYEGKN